MKEILLLLISAIFVNNCVLARFLGLCPFLGVSRKIDTAIGMSMAVTFVMTMAASITWFLQYLVLNPLNLQYLQTIVFILIIATLVQFVEMVIQKISPPLYRALGIYLPLITTNCAVLGVAILCVQKNLSFIQTVFFSFGSAVGFGFALILFAGIRERLEFSDIPESFKGTAIALITAGLLSLAFMGFIGLVKF